MFCTKCGQQLPDYANFCTRCGAPQQKIRASQRKFTFKRNLFTPRISPAQLEQVECAMNQLQDSVRLVNTTVNPEVFFRRLNFTLDLLLFLQTFERYGIFTNSSPTQDFN